MPESFVEHEVGIGESPLVTRFDAIPGFWNYLFGLDANDLIAELIQNDLDQGATRTEITFGENHLVCEGNGTPVDASGWQRLRTILGAGDEVPAKRGMFGVKNHGLKTAFTIGDELRLLSAGNAIVQTLYAKGRDMPPHPAASANPTSDPTGPATGCRVLVSYRRADLKPSEGEALQLSAITANEIDALFEASCESLPEQFAGVVSPEITPRYEVVLRHWRLGEARFEFSCTRARRIGRRMEAFQRRCVVTGTLSGHPDALREQAVRRMTPLTGVLRNRVASFFRRGRRFFVEVSWPADARGKPKVGKGRFRYPLGYPLDSHKARTGHTASFTGPFASDSERHGPAWNEATNSELRAACESLFVDALAHFSISRWGADGLIPVVPSSDVDDGDGIVRAILAELAERGALPVLPWTKAAAVATRGKSRTAVRTLARQRSIRVVAEQRRYRFVVPTLACTDEARDIHSGLSLLCPRSEMQLDARVHSEIIRLLADGHTSGFGSQFTTFDENDVLARLRGKGNEYFGPIGNPDREFAEPLLARTYLGLVELVIDQDELEDTEEDSLIDAMVLPDVRHRPTRMLDLYAGVSVPVDVPDLDLPPILHRDLTTHALFRRRKWQRPRFTMATFLGAGVLETASPEARRRFWDWLRVNEEHARRHRSKLAVLEVWPDERGRLCRISDLCQPSRRASQALGSYVRRPNDQVRRSRLVSIGGKAATSIRRVPTMDEVAQWLQGRMVGLEPGEIADATRLSSLRRLELDLAVLLRDRGSASRLKATDAALPALAKDGSLQRRDAVVKASRRNNRFALPGRFVLSERSRAPILDRISPAMDDPSANMLLSALREDSANISALHARLQKVLELTEPGDAERNQLAEMAILPVDGELRAATDLAFRGSGRDFWGDWKTRISGRQLSQDDQRRFRAVGVTSGVPNEITSRRFFRWLAQQDDPDTLTHHVPCVLRHILHRTGPTLWAPSYTDEPFIPARGQNGLRLVSLHVARRTHVYLSDAGDIGDAIVRKDRAVFLVVDRAKEVTEPIANALRQLGVRSLREKLGEPRRVTGTGDAGRPDNDVVAVLNRLTSAPFRRTFRKRLEQLGVDPELLRHDWHDRLRRVREVCASMRVEARYHLRGRSYSVSVDAGFDPPSGVFYMRGDGSVGVDTLYESLASQLVFKPAARPIHHLALERAVGLEIVDQSFGRPDRSGTDDSGEPGDARSGPSHDAPHAEPDARMDDEDDDPGEAKGGHSPFDPDPSRNRPNPAPLRTAGGDAQARHSKRSGERSSAGNGGQPRSEPALEKEHRRALNRDHYASHCQMCLCQRSPQELAPPGSYVEWQEVRQRVMEAHHPDLVSAGGARHGGNLILLCKLHHDNYGRQLSRAAVTAALRHKTNTRSISFGGGASLTGQQIELTISGTGEAIQLFFTDDHIDYWLSEDMESA